MQAKVPMDIGIEDQIIGPLSFRQLIILLIGGSISYMLYKSVPSTITITFFVIPIILLTLSFAFLKINEMSFAHFLVALYIFLIIPKVMIWIQKDDWINKDDLDDEEKKLEEYKKIKQEILFKSKINIMQHINQITDVLNRKGFINPEILENSLAVENMEDEEYFQKIYRDDSYDFQEHINRINKLLSEQKKEIVEKNKEKELEEDPLADIKKTFSSVLNNINKNKNNKK